MNFELVQQALLKQDIHKLIEIRDILWADIEIYNTLADDVSYLGLRIDTYKYMINKADESRLNYQFIDRHIPKQQG